MRLANLPLLAMIVSSHVALATAALGGNPAMPRTGQPAPQHDDARTSAILTSLSKAWFRGEWAAYKAKFVSQDGRIVDNANGAASHSEGQGYGLLLALEAGDSAAFDTIWRWTVDHLRKRPDALLAWKWDPQKQDVADLNNASDGDILVAWALTRAATTFQRPDYETEAQHLVEALAAKVITRRGRDVILLPAASGFGAKDQPGGPVVNLSYWIFAAFRDLAHLEPDVDWEGLRQTGLRLLATSQFGPLRLPTDWIALGGSASAPATNFQPVFGYDAIRIPLYLAQDLDVPREALDRFAAKAAMASAHNPSVIDVATGTIGRPMQGAGYRLVFALARCVARGDTIPPELMSARDQLYYPETLRLLCISVLQERLPQCL